MEVDQENRVIPVANLPGCNPSKWGQRLQFLPPLCVILITAITLALPQSQAKSSVQATSRGILLVPDPSTLADGASAPDFSLPGVDGDIHKLSEYAGAKVLAVVFQCNTCPVSQLYEARIEKLYRDYKDKGVALVAINPNNPDSVRLDEESYSDVTDSLDDMKVRAEYKHLDYPYLYDGDKQTVAMKYGPVATPQIFIFDQARKLQYEGRIDDSCRMGL